MQIEEEEVFKRSKTGFSKAWYEYMNSLYIRGDNTVENARSWGALIGKDLYPDLDGQSVADYVKEYFETH